MDDIVIIENKIYEIRGQKLCLTLIWQKCMRVETKHLKEQVDEVILNDFQPISCSS